MPSTAGLTSPANAPDIVSFNGHFDFSRLLSAEGDQTGDPTQILDTTGVRAADAGNEITQERLLFSLGCHSGLEIPTNEVSNVIPGGVDSWASTFADEGAIWVGNTATAMPTTSTFVLGQAHGSLRPEPERVGLHRWRLSEAKQLYAAQSGVLDPYDLKADMESTYYGMPNYTLSGLTKPVANSAATTRAVPRAGPGHRSADGVDQPQPERRHQSQPARHGHAARGWDLLRGQQLDVGADYGRIPH